MAVTADLNGKNYKLGRGKVYLDIYPNGISYTNSTRGEGERYIGNTPGFSTTSETENLDHYDSDQGVREKDASVQLQRDVSGTLTCDNISPENQALFIQGATETAVQTSATGEVDTVVAKRGRFYQLGVSDAFPGGVQNITVTGITKGSGTPTTITPAGNYEVEADTGRVYIEVDAPDIPDGTEITITYNVAAGTYKRVLATGTPTYAAMRYIEDNGYGKNQIWYFPLVKLTPDGDYELKGDEWQTMTFAVEILKKGSLVSTTITDRIAPTP